MTSPAFRCIACEGISSVLYLAGCRDLYLGHPLVVDYSRCSSCGLVQQHPLPHDLGALYSDYPIHAGRSGLHSWFRRLFLSNVYLQSRTLPADARLLDFGCGDGWFLNSVKKEGLACEGYEFQPDHARRLSAHLGMTVFSDMDQLLRERTGAYQAITLHNVLEHLPDLRATLASLGSLLAPGGFVYVVVPNIESWEARLFGRRWHGLDPPRHVSFPTPSVMRALAHGAGLELESSDCVAFPNTSAASFVSAMVGRYHHALFLIALPVGMALSRIAPSGSRSYVLRRRENAA